MTKTELLALADALCFNGRYGYETQEQSAERRIEERANSADILRKLAALEPVAWEVTDPSVGAAWVDDAPHKGLPSLPLFDLAGVIDHE